MEGFFNRIKHFRGLATRYDRRPDDFLAALKLAAIRIWLNAKSVHGLSEPQSRVDQRTTLIRSRSVATEPPLSHVE